MAERKGNLVSYRPDIKVLDATIRDGGLVNAFNFGDGCVRALYKAVADAGIEYMEFGYRADRDLFPGDANGKWKFCKDDDIRAIVGDMAGGPKIAVMADVGRCNFRRDIHPKSESPVDLVRVATYINTIPAAMEMIDDAHGKGYETSCNVMAVSTAGERDIRAALELLASSPVDIVYLVDSYGALYPDQVNHLTDLYLEILEPAGKKLGIHAHNNQQLAFANTIESCSTGASFLDATVLGMGRGAGNCALELLLNFLKNPRYSIVPVYRFIEEWMPMVCQGQEPTWGYALPYLMTGHFNIHPRPAIEAVRQRRTDYATLYEDLSDPG